MESIETHPRTKVLSNGAIYDLDRGRIISGPPGGGPHAISSDNSHALLAKRRLVGLRAQLRGLARAEGIDPSDIDDDLLLQAGSAVEALTLHMAQTFKKSNNLRGMSEAYNALTAPLSGDRRERAEPNEPGAGPDVLVLIAQYIQRAERNEPGAGAAIDGDIIE